MRITLFGTGYVGLVTGTCFAEMGNDVMCVDVDEDKIAALLRGEIPIFEPGLESMVQANTASGRLKFTTDAAAGISHGEVIFIAVGTPSDEDGSADLKYVLQVADTIGSHMTSRKVIVDKSTVPVGTADQVRQTVAAALAKRSADVEFDVVSNPEFLKEGAAVADFMKPDRVVIGSSEQWSKDMLDRLYAPFNRNHDKIVHMDVRSAELTKYAANVMLATKISLMNEFANLAERLDADVEAVRRGIGSDPRIGHHFIYPGAGYGGSCFPKDVKALIHTASEIGYDAEIIRAVEAVNQRQKHVLVDKIIEHFGGKLNGLTFALWGLAFKPNTDDMREAPARSVMESLWEHGAKVRAYDPTAMEEARRIYGERDDLTLCEQRDETLNGASALIIITEWNQFRSPDFELLRGALKQPVIFDGRNLFEPELMRGIGFSHYSIGRPSVRASS